MVVPRAVEIPLTPPQAVEETDASVWLPDGVPAGRAALILAHGAGTDMRHHLVAGTAAALAEAGHPVATFNFAYTAAGRRRPDPVPRLRAAWQDAIAALPPLLGRNRPLVIGGRSMGGRIASMVAAADGAGLAGCVFLAYPLHPPGRPEKLEERTAHWPDLRVPLLFMTGDRDTMAPIEALEQAIGERLDDRDVTLHVLRGADHSYRVRAADDRDADDLRAEVVTTIVGWLSARWG